MPMRSPRHLAPPRRPWRLLLFAFGLTASVLAALVASAWSSVPDGAVISTLEIAREPGLSDILVGNAQWRDCVRGVADILMGRFEMEDIMASPGLDNLHIIESGPAAGG